jgi:hypothetical protein
MSPQKSFFRPKIAPNAPKPFLRQKIAQIVPKMPQNTPKTEK